MPKRKSNSSATNGKAKKKVSELKAGEWIAKETGFETKLTHAATSPDPITGAILTPVYQSTTFVQESIENYLGKGYSYSRTSNPTVTALENKVAVLEGGVGAACFATGMAATTAVLSGYLKTGDHCVITDCSYGGTNRSCRVFFSEYGIEFDFVDFRDLNIIKKACKKNTKLIFSETPANPTLTLSDVESISKFARSKGIMHVCDSTFATPVMLRPLDLGCDMVIQSLTKYYDGHNMTVGGAVACATKEIHEQIKFMQNVHGNIMTPHNAFLVLQTSKTMALRVKKQSANAQAVAEFLEKHPKVLRVNYPGLKSFPQKKLADKMHLNGIHGGMLWFEVHGGTEAGRNLMNRMQRPWSLCENLGAVESICTAPAVMTHANMTKEDRAKVGISDGFVRLSCGIEDIEDLIFALKSALDSL